jgi:cytochrome b561
MNSSSKLDRYSGASIAIHWVTVLCFVGLYVAINVSDLFDKGTAQRVFARDTHNSLGLLVFVMVWLRIVLRVFGTTPAIVPAPPAWQEKLGKAVHGLLYVLMVVMPLLGWAVLSARGRPISFFVLPLPALLDADKALGRQIMAVHEWGGTLGYFLIGGHAVAALFHHYFVKDNTLRRMWFR